MNSENRVERRGGSRPGAGRKKRDRQTVVLTIDPAIISRLDVVTNNRSRYIAELLERELPPQRTAEGENDHDAVTSST